MAVTLASHEEQEIICHAASSRSRSSSPARSTRPGPEDVADELGVRLQVQQFLDDWHYNAVHSGMAKTWDRRKALGAALDLLEINGVAFGEGAKEKCLILNEEAVIDCIVESMPVAVMENFEKIAQQLMSVLSQISSARRALELGEEEGLRAVCEVDDELGISRKVLRNATVVAAKQVAKIIDTHGSWRRRTEERIARLMRAAEDAERARQQCLATETQLAEFGYMTNQKSRSCLMGLAASQDQAVLHTSFATWHGALMKAKAQEDIRKKFEAELAEAEDKLWKLKERGLANVHATLGRHASEACSLMLGQCFGEWAQQAEDSRRDGTTAEQLKQVQARLMDVQEKRRANMTKVVSRMCSDSVAGALHGAIIAWTQAVEDAKKDKALEGEVKKVQREVQEHLASQKQGAMSVFERLGAGSNDGLLQTAMSAWIQQVEEDRKTREMKSKLDGACSKLVFFKDRQLVNACKVQGRINRQAEMFVCMRVLNGWLLATKAERVTRHFNKKLDSKRKQLSGVQTLFKTFAQQLEQGLGGVEDGEDSSRITNIKPMPRKSVPRTEKKSSRGERVEPVMQKSKGTFSLPDIRKPPMWESELSVRRER